MKIRIEIECDNDAFGRNPKIEIGRIINRLAGDLKRDGMKLLAGGHKLRDLNGNTVGKAVIVEDEATPTVAEFFAQARAASPFQPE